MLGESILFYDIVNSGQYVNKILEAFFEEVTIVKNKCMHFQQENASVCTTKIQRRYYRMFPMMNNQ
jgi:hypothetical protein